MIEKIVQLRENDVELRFMFEEENARENEYLSEIQVGISGIDGWTVIGYQDLQDALYRMGYDLCKR